MQEAADDDATYGSEFLGGQNPFAYFAPVAENIKIAPLSAYDQGCVELIQNSFSDYFQGNVDFDKAKATLRLLLKSVILRSLRLNGRNNVDSSEDFVCKNILQNTIKKIMSM